MLQTYIEPDCDICRHLDSDICNECEHFEGVRDDFFIPLSKEEIVKRKEKLHNQAIEKAISAWINCDYTDFFRSSFESAITCAAYEHYKSVFMGVYIADENYLVATDLKTLIELHCRDIPKELVGQVIMRLGENQAAITTGRFPDYKAILDNCSNYNTKPFKLIKLETVDENDECIFQHCRRNDILMNWLLTGDNKFLINHEYLNKVLQCLTGEVFIKYSPKNHIQPIFLIAENGRGVVCPINYDICGRGVYL